MKLWSLSWLAYAPPREAKLDTTPEPPSSPVPAQPPSIFSLSELPMPWSNGHFFSGLNWFRPHFPHPKLADTLSSKPAPSSTQTAKPIQTKNGLPELTGDPKAQIRSIQGLPSAEDPKIHLFLQKVALKHPLPEVRLSALAKLAESQAWPLENLKIFLAATLQENNWDNQTLTQKSLEDFSKKKDKTLAQNFLIESFHWREGHHQESEQAKILEILSHWQNGKTKSLLLDILKNHSSDLLKQQALDILDKTFHSPHLQKLWFHIFTHTQDPHLKIQALSFVSPQNAKHDWPILMQIFQKPQEPLVFAALCQQIVKVDPRRGSALLISSYQTETKQRGDPLRQHSSLTTLKLYYDPSARSWPIQQPVSKDQIHLGSLVEALVQNGIRAEAVYQDFFNRISPNAPYRYIACALWGLFLLEDKDSLEKIETFFSGLDPLAQTDLVRNLLTYAPENPRDLKILSRWFGKKLLSENPLPWIRGLCEKNGIKLTPNLIPELGILSHSSNPHTDPKTQYFAIELLAQLLQGKDLTSSSQAKWQLQKTFKQSDLPEDLKENLKKIIPQAPQAALATELQAFLEVIQDPYADLSVKKSAAKKLFSQSALSPYELHFEQNPTSSKIKKSKRWSKDPTDLIFEDLETIVQYFYIYQSIKSQLQNMAPLTARLQDKSLAKRVYSYEASIPILIKREYPHPVTEAQKTRWQKTGKQPEHISFNSAQAYYSDLSLVFRRYETPETLNRRFPFSMGHETGHLLMHLLYGGLYPRTPGHSHDLLHDALLEDKTSPGSAWSEGFATFVSFLFTDTSLDKTNAYFLDSHKMQDWSQSRSLRDQLSNEFVVASLLYSIANAKKVRGSYVPPQQLLSTPTTQARDCFSAITETMQHRGDQLRTHKDLRDFLKDFVKRHPQYHRQTLDILKSYQLSAWLD